MFMANGMAVLARELGAEGSPYWREKARLGAKGGREKMVGYMANKCHKSIKMF